MFGDIISQRYDFYVIYKVRIGQNSCQMTQKHTFFEKRVEKFWKFRNSYYFCAPKQTGCSSARLEYTSGGRVVAGSNPVIPTMLSAKPSIARSEVFVFMFGASLFAYHNKHLRDIFKMSRRLFLQLNEKKKGQTSRFVPFSSGGRTRTSDLWVMSPTSCQLLHSAI